MKRPELIPPDVWDKLTVSNAVTSGLLGDFPDELERLVENESRRISEASDESMLARMLAENMDAESVRKACRIVRMHERSIHNGPRPTRIPMDIWDTMTVREALLYGFMEEYNDHKGLNLDALVCMYPITSRIAKSIRCKLQRIDDVAIDGKCRAIRSERAQNARQSACKKHELFPGGNFCMWCHTPMDALDKHISANVLRPNRCAKHEVHTVDGNAYCSWCDASESDLLDAMLEERKPDTVHAQLRAIAKSEIDRAVQLGKSMSEFKQALEIALHVHTCTSCFENERCTDDCTIEPDLGTTNDGIPKGSHLRCAACKPEPKKPESPPLAFREDICRNSGPLLPPFEAGEPADRVTVMMMYPEVGKHNRVVRCSLRLRALGESTIEYHRELGVAVPKFVWVSARRASNISREQIAEEVLSFDLAVRTGGPLAVAAYGLILFALAVGAAREREHVRAAICAADDAMDAVFRAAREVSKG